MDFLNIKALDLLGNLNNHAPNEKEVFLAEMIIYLLCGNYKIKFNQLDVIFSQTENPIVNFLKESMESYRHSISHLSRVQKKESTILFERKEGIKYQKINLEAI